MPADRLQRALDAIDAVNAADPTMVLDGGVPRPRELVHAEKLTAWIERLVPEPGEALRIAARGQHIQRWRYPRSSFPAGRSGYLRWRTQLYRYHAAETAAILERHGYDEATISRVEAIISKSAPPGDAEAQAIEDGLCLVFLETQLAEVANRLDREKMVNILRRTWRKMSPPARQLALELDLDDEGRALIAAALSES